MEEIMYYLIDVGSSSVKIYKYFERKTILLEKKSYSFSKVYAKKCMQPLEKADKEILYKIFEYLKEKYSLKRNNTKLFATGHFRNILNTRDLVDEFYQETGLFFNIVSQDLEMFYLDNKFAEYSKYIGQTIAINLGGGSSEIIYYSNGTTFRNEKKLDFGVNSIKQQFSLINSVNSSEILQDIIEYVISKLPDTIENCQNLILTGGELTFMKLCEYPLISNDLFDDTYHPYIIKSNEYYKYNKFLFEKDIDFLLSKMPENPMWMSGARAYCAIAQAICQKYSVENIIPSDFNMIDGVVAQEAKTVTVCGSFNRHLEKIAVVIEQLKRSGFVVLSPQNTDVIGDENGFVVFKNDVIKNHCTWPIESLHLQAIEKSDMVVICNFDNYVGFSTIVELGAAYICGKKIVFIEDNELAENMDSPIEIGLLQ